MPGEKLKKFREIKEFSDEEKNMCLSEMKRLLSEDDKLSKLQSNDAYLERFLYSTDFIVKRAFKKIKLFYEFLEENPEWFAMDAPTSKKNIIDQDIRVLTPVYDKVGRRVYIFKTANMSSQTMDLMSDIVAVDDYLMEMLLANDPQFKNGVCVIVDISNFPWNIMKWLTPYNIRSCLKRMFSMPIKEYKIHIVKKSRIIHVVLKIIWPFLSQEIRDGIIFHFDDLEGLYEYIDKDVLPIEYGGTNDMDYTKCHEQVFEKDELIANSFKINRRDYLKRVDEHGNED